MMTAVQGIVAAGTVAYLTRDATWEKIAFTSNHLFYLVGIAAGASAVEIPHFSLAAKVVFCLTPIVLIEHLRHGHVSTAKARSFGFHFNHFYYAAAVVSTLVLVALGHTAYGVGFFAVMMLDMISRSKNVSAYAQTAFERSATTAALLTFASYAAKLATPRGQYIMAVVAAQAFLPRIRKIIRDILSDSSSVPDIHDAPRPKQRPIYQNRPWYEPRPIHTGSDLWLVRFDRNMMRSVSFLPSYSVARSESGAYLNGLQNLTGKLPHKF